MSPRMALLCVALALAIAGSQAQTAPTAVPSMAAIEKEVQSEWFWGRGPGVNAVLPRVAFGMSGGN